MAKAKIITKEPKKRVKNRVQLTMSVDEAETLLGVVMRIGGSTTDSPRKHTNDIEYALLDAGLSDPNHKTSNYNRAIYFFNFDQVTHTRWGF